MPVAMVAARKLDTPKKTVDAAKEGADSASQRPVTSPFAVHGRTPLMNVFLLTVLALGGANGAALHGGSNGGAATGSCDGCQGGGGHGHGGGWWLGHKLHGHCAGPMPQTCYDPAYGCYPGTRYMNRYPAFHGTYYRRPYNYRNVFDYPWHADLHEPTSFFSYGVTGDPGGARADFAPEPLIPVPTPSAALPLHRQIERSTAEAPRARSPRGLSTLRR